MGTAIGYAHLISTPIGGVGIPLAIACNDELAEHLRLENGTAPIWKKSAEWVN